MYYFRNPSIQAINCTIHLQSRSDQFHLFIGNLNFTKLDERLQRSDDDVESAKNWRRLQIRKPRKQISDQQLYFLLEPIYFTMSGGEIQNARVAKDDPVWSVNFKKALVFQLQTKLGNQLEENTASKNISINFSICRLFQHDQFMSVLHSFKVK